jgi:long-chain fatty acid transport protein
VREAVTVLAVVLSGAEALASPQDLSGFGARSPALAGTGATWADDYTAVHANPAGLSRARRRQFTLGYAVAGFELSLGGAHVAADPGRATIIGLTLPVPLRGPLQDRVAVGVGFHTPLAVVVRGRILRPETPQYGTLVDRVQSVAVQLGAGLDLGYGLRAGGGVAALAGLTGSVLVAADATGRASSRIDDQLVASYAPVLGASFERGPFSVALTLRGSLVARFLVTIEARDLGVTIPVLDISGVAQYDPAQAHLEFGYAHGGYTAALAATFKRWGAYPGPVTATTEGSPAPPAADFVDTVVLRGALERRWALPDGALFALRGGVFLEPTPAPSATAARAHLDNARLALCAGVGLGAEALGTRALLDVYVQHHTLFTRTHADGSRYGGGAVFAGLTLGVTF